MIKFEVLAMKIDTDELHTIFLLKKNVWQDIIKMILGYLPIVASEILKEWKVVITLVGQGYESTEGQNDYKTGIRMTYRGQGQPMNIIPNWWSNAERELNMWANVKTKNGKNLKVKALVDSGYTYTRIDKQLVKDKRIQMKSINFSFEVFNTDGTKNREVTKVVPLEIEINRHKEQLEAAVMDLNGMDMFLGHDWLVKHNLEVN